jgi:transposase
VVVEASGGWELDLVSALAVAGLPAAVMNPTRVRNFAKELGQYAKTDKIDAPVLAHFAAVVQPPVRPLKSGEQAQLAAVNSRCQQLVAHCHEWPDKKEGMLFVKGVGPVTATTLLADLPELGTLSRQQVALTVCMRKLLVILNAMICDMEPWQLRANLV